MEEELNELGKLKENAFEEETMMFESGEDNLKKAQEIINENVKLKEFHPLLFLSISVLWNRDSTRSCLCSFRLSRNPAASSSFIFSISSGSMSVAFTLAYTLPSPADIFYLNNTNPYPRTI